MEQENNLQSVRYMDILTNFAFKTLLGQDRNKALLIDFLNALIRRPDKITRIRYLPTEHLGKTDEARKAFFDIHCITSKEEWFIIEMQVAKQEHFLDRCLFYSVTQNIILIELPGFKKTLQESGNKIDRWLYCFKHLGRLKNRPEELSGKIFERLFEEAEINKLTPEDMELYNKSITKDRDVRNMMDYSRKEGKMEGLEERIEKGKTFKALDIAKNLLDLRFPINDIAKATGLTPEQILSL
jgi:hypothetical protein